jgi:MYXO-CTERM domain-containing protein
MRGGWCDASGDVSKYFSHLAYANFMNPQQTPMVTWELTAAAERIPDLLNAAGAMGAIRDEALWGADYLYRALSTDDYFYMVVFSFFSPNATDRRVCGLLANSVTNNKWQATFRAGGGMAIAALARISRWNQNGMTFTSQNYLDGAKRAFANLLVYNTSYIDDGKENVIDDYGALMAATELWIATGDTQYQGEARKRMNNLAGRMTPAGYFRADDATRPFWHAADAGLPIVALVRYLDQETDATSRATALATIKKALDYELTVTGAVGNPYGYARQSFTYQGAVKDGFFIPQDNETGWWWQGENARLASLAAAAILGGRLVYPANGGWGVDDRLARFASQQIAWILGSNPYDVCFMHGFGQTNPPVVTANFGHGTQKGGISNGITGLEGNGDGTGIDYKTSDNGNEWRWIEQWLPHAGWFLTAVSAMAQVPPGDVGVGSDAGLGGGGDAATSPIDGGGSDGGTGMGMGTGPGGGEDAGLGGGSSSGGVAGEQPGGVKASASCGCRAAGADRGGEWWSWAFALVVAGAGVRRRKSSLNGFDAGKHLGDEGRSRTYQVDADPWE